MTATLSQYFTPAWAADLLVTRHFGWLGPRDLVVEPSCGPGAFLAAVPADVEAIGVEIDPTLADAARANTGRQVITGDFFQVKLDRPVSCLIGNPPFRARVIDDFLTRAHSMLIPGGTVGFILPAYYLQTAGKVVRLSAEWSLSTEMIPRNLFDGLTKPLTFTIFRKDSRAYLVGMSLYQEMDAVSRMHPDIQRIFTDAGRGSVWGRVCEEALLILGGRATLSDVYRLIEPKRPTPNPAWKQQIRAVMGRHFRRIRPGLFEHPGIPA